MSLIERTDWIDWNGGAIDGADDDVIDLCISAAEDFVKAATGLVLESAAVTDTLDGSGPRIGGKSREVLMLDRAYRPWSASVTPTVTENGETLTVAAGYSTTADVIYDPTRGRLVRVRQSSQSQVVFPGYRSQPGWAPGVQNIVATYTGGYVAGSVPADLQLLLYGLTKLFYTDPKRLGVAQATKAGHSFQVPLELPVHLQMALDQMKGW